MCLAPQRRAIFRHLNFKKWSEHAMFCIFWLWNVLLATAACHFSTSQLSKVSQDRQFFSILTCKCASPQRRAIFWHPNFQKWAKRVSFSILTCKCASRHSGVQFFYIWTSKSAPELVCFVHFDFKMCFSLQRRAIFLVCSERLPPHPPL